MKTSINPLNISYRFQLAGRKASEPCREGSDPSIVFHDGIYWLFPSKSGGYWHSRDMVNWAFVRSQTLPVEGYAPDVWVMDGRLYYTTGDTDGVAAAIYRAIDPFKDTWERLSKPLPYVDPKVFQDDDGRVYLYYGCSPVAPLMGVELDRTTLKIKNVPQELFNTNSSRRGWERAGEDNLSPPGAQTWLEGVWVNKFKGRYYLQYSSPGTEYNVYSDAVAVADAPLGPYTLGDDNPLSLKTRGFMTGAGHGCTFRDIHGNWWHAATMRISVRQIYERRIGLWPAGFYEDGAMFCNTRFGDYPQYIPDRVWNPLADSFTGWMLQSYLCKATASSAMPGHGPELAVDEDVRTYWAAESRRPGEWIQLDLGARVSIRAVQLNFAEVHCSRHGFDGPGGWHHYVLEASDDGRSWTMLVDHSRRDADCPHEYLELERAVQVRYIKATILSMPAGGYPAMSGFRAFGDDGSGAPECPSRLSVHRKQEDPCVALVTWSSPDKAQGCNVLWGRSPDRMHHCCQVYGADSLTLRSLDADKRYVVSAEAFGRGGVSARTKPLAI